VLLSVHSNIAMITNAVNASIAYIRASRSAGTKAEDMPEIMAGQVASLKTVIVNAQYDTADATSAMIVLGDAPFVDEHRADLVAHIHAKTQSGASNVGGPMKNSNAAQVHRFLYNYMTSAIWDKQADRNCTEMDRVSDMVTLCHRIGLYFPDVTSRKIIVAIMILAHGTSPSPRGAKAMYDLFATINNDRRPLKKHAATTMSIYPEKITSFIDVHPTLYAADAQPVVSRLSKNDVDDLASTIPVRKTSALLRTDACMNTSMNLPTIGMPSSSNANPMLMNMFMTMMRNATGGADARDGDTPLTMLRRRGMMQLTDSAPHQHALTDERQPLLAAIGDQSSVTDSAGASSDCHHDAHIAAGIATPVGNSGVETDIDALLDAGLGARQPPAKKPKLATAVAAVMKKPARATAATAVAIFDRSSPPKFGTQCPCIFNKCKIYEASTKFRVVPAPDRSAYDKPFTFNAASKKTAWASLIKYCLNPSIPKGSKNYVNIGK
jgi:hypothetical protein